ncbi:MAG: hyaluronate lyase, partial [Bacillota bacterium]|nr:hyaluronate lyase [Bacillota bacterium]
MVYLEICTCSGDIMSFMNVVDPDLAEVMFRVIDLRFQNTLMPAQGEAALALLDEARARWAGRYILVVEGTVPTRFAGRASVVADRKGVPITGLEAVRLLAERARAVVANGVCASFGG